MNIRSTCRRGDEWILSRSLVVEFVAGTERNGAKVGKFLTEKLVFLGVIFLLMSSNCLFSKEAIEPVCWFGDHMVLQRNMAVPVWGWANPGEEITVKIAGQSVQAPVEKDGSWKVTLAPMEPGGPFDMEISGASETKVIRDVLIGDVWICGGQSNMWRPFIDVDQKVPEKDWKMMPGPDGEHYPKSDQGLEQIRLYHVGHNGSADPVQDIPRAPTWGPFERTRMNRDIAPESWRVCSPDALRNFSRLGFFFGEAIQREIGVPVGLIVNAMGSSSINQWASAEVIDKLLERPPSPIKPVRYKENREEKYSGLFNGMVYPLIGFPIKGFIWWQGETDTIDKEPFDIEAYPRGTFKEVITDYRKRWGQGDFPFLFVQLQNHFARGKGMNVRDYQMQALELPNTAMVVTVDIAGGVHPLNKYDISQRLVQAALAVAYDRPLLFSGPIYQSAKVEGDQIRISFSHVGAGLKVGTGLFNNKLKPLSESSDSNAPFEIQSAEGKWVKADAKIDGDTVVLSAPGVTNPQFAAYAMSRTDPENTVLQTTLFNAEGLPASPFDSQTWTGLKDPKSP